MELIEKLKIELDETLSADNLPYIKIETAAKLMGADADCLRQSIYNGTCPFGWGYGGNGLRNGYARIPKLPFRSFMLGGK
jgi:hypothetical protein